MSVALTADLLSEIEDILTYCSPDCNIIIGGDFNMNFDDNTEMCRLLKNFLYDHDSDLLSRWR